MQTKHGWEIHEPSKQRMAEIEQNGKKQGDGKTRNTVLCKTTRERTTPKARTTNPK